MATQQVTITKKEIKDIIRNTIKEEFFKLRLELTSLISDNEMAEIEKTYKKPDKDIIHSELIEI